MVDLDLIRKYDVSGPRYTSYPTALHFVPRTHDWWLDALRRSEQQGGRDASLYLHLPFCETLCLYCGCNVVITRNRERITEYLRYLEMEVTLLQRLVNIRRPVTQIHWGGGSPSYLLPEEIVQLGGLLREHFNIAADAEIGVEIDPRRLTEEHVQAFRSVGFNRASIGVQDFDPTVQESVRRIQPEEETRNALEWCRRAGFGSINIDLIYGLPHQTPESFRETLRKVAELSPDRLAIFNFAYVPWMKPHQKALDPASIPEREVKMELQKEILERLGEAGYVYIGMDHFAKPDDELTLAQRNGTLHRNFQGYSTHAETDLIGLGVTAISNTEECYAQNSKLLPDYYLRLTRNELPAVLGVELSRDDRIRSHIIMTLMCNLELSKSAVERMFDIEFDRYFADLDVSPFVEDGLLELDGDCIRVTDRGRLFLRNIAMQFDAYLKKGTERYSRTV